MVKTSTAGRFAKSTLQAMRETGPVEVPASICEGLAVHAPIDPPINPKYKEFVVSHAASGKRIGRFATERDAKIFAVRMAGVIDWTASESEVVRQSSTVLAAMHDARDGLKYRH